jgi:hypothetical protein
MRIGCGGLKGFASIAGEGVQQFCVHSVRLGTLRSHFVVEATPVVDVRKGEDHDE